MQEEDRKLEQAEESAGREEEDAVTAPKVCGGCIEVGKELELEREPEGGSTEQRTSHKYGFPNFACIYVLQFLGDEVEQGLSGPDQNFRKAQEIF